MKDNLEPPLRPTQYAEHILVTAILDKTYASGSALPNERSLAQQIGVTRPTLRETLQRLANEGWVKIQHGKPTVVNDFWTAGGLSMLGTLAKYGNYLPNGFITQLLEVRVTLLPTVARLAATYQPRKILNYLDHKPRLSDNTELYARYDWGLQMLMARYSGNPIYSLILNDFAAVFQNMAARYFKPEKSRNASQIYYQKLSDAIARKDHSVEKTVKTAMQQSIKIWHAIRATIP
jgi:GntR family negative regulator for fad regulon and positive regulator of fabA